MSSTRLVSKNSKITKNFISCRSRVLSKSTAGLPQFSSHAQAKRQSLKTKINTFVLMREQPKTPNPQTSSKAGRASCLEIQSG